MKIIQDEIKLIFRRQNINVATLLVSRKYSYSIRFKAHSPMLKKFSSYYLHIKDKNLELRTKHQG